MSSEVYSNLFYQKKLRPAANELRKQMTKAEACLWKYALRARGMMGFQFRRQRPVLDYIADFMCKELLLIIEVDGGIHDNPDAEEKDRLRQHAQEAVGFEFLRFSNEDVLKNMAGVRMAIEDWIVAKLERHG